MIANYNTEVKRWTFMPQNPKEMGAATKYRKKKKITRIGYSPAEFADILRALEKIYNATPKPKPKKKTKAKVVPKKVTKGKKTKKTSTKKPLPKNQAPPSTGTTDSTAHTEGEALRLMDL